MSHALTMVNPLVALFLVVLAAVLLGSFRRDRRGQLELFGKTGIGPTKAGKYSERPGDPEFQAACHELRNFMMRDGGTRPCDLRSAMVAAIAESVASDFRLAPPLLHGTKVMEVVGVFPVLHNLKLVKSLIGEKVSSG